MVNQVQIDGNMFKLLMSGFRLHQTGYYLLDNGNLSGLHLLNPTVAVWAALRSIKTRQLA